MENLYLCPLIKHKKSISIKYQAGFVFLHYLQHIYSINSLFDYLLSVL